MERHTHRELEKVVAESAGWMTPDEIRDRDDRGPVDSGLFTAAASVA